MALVATETVEPGSAAVAVRDQARPRMPLPSVVWIRVQPGSVPTVVVVELVVRNSSRVSPACTAAGTVTVWLVRLPAVLAAPTRTTSGAVRVKVCGRRRSRCRRTR